MYKRKEKLKLLFKYNSISGSRTNYFKYNQNKYKEDEINLHEQFKFKAFCLLRNKGFNVLVEAEMKDGKKPDLVYWNEDLSQVGIIEIVSSESEESIKRKTNEYDINFDLTFVYVNKPLEIQLTI